MDLASLFPRCVTASTVVELFKPTTSHNFPVSATGAGDKRTVLTSWKVSVVVFLALQVANESESHFGATVTLSTCETM